MAFTKLNDSFCTMNQKMAHLFADISLSFIAGKSGHIDVPLLTKMESMY